MMFAVKSHPRAAALWYSRLSATRISLDAPSTLGSSVGFSQSAASQVQVPSQSLAGGSSSPQSGWLQGTIPGSSSLT